jgi:Na+/H+ antiporter NhaD/arsenite permease-like protein
MAAPMTASPPTLVGLPVELYLFVAMLTGIAFVHRRALPIALVGTTVIAAYKVLWSPFREGAGVAGLAAQARHESVILVNLLLLLLGFALLAAHFEKTRIPARLPHYLPSDWKGPLVLLWLVFLLSAFLDNIAAAMVGATVALTVFRGRVHMGFLAAIVAAANAGGAGSVIGDTTTTMMWIAGVPALEVLHAFVAAIVAVAFCGTIAARQQHALQPIQTEETVDVRVDWTLLAIVIAVLAAAVTVNVIVNLRFHRHADAFPFLGATVWGVLLLFTPVRRPDWALLHEALRGAIFLLALVFAASMMPVNELPAASSQTAFGLGVLSAVFDNIPLTALALKQGGYDWGFLAYAVGFGGSMLWFGSSAGVAVSNLFPDARSAGQWLRHGWHVAVAYVLGFFVMLVLLGFEPGATPRTATALPAPEVTAPRSDRQ